MEAVGLSQSAYKAIEKYAKKKNISKQKAASIIIKEYIASAEKIEREAKKNGFAEKRLDYILSTCKKYSKKDKDGYVHCGAYPFGDSVTCECKVFQILNWDCDDTEEERE